MRKNIKVKTILTICLTFLLLGDKALATVGGGILLRDFHYDEKEQVVYFIFDQSATGLGTISIVRYDPKTQNEEWVTWYPFTGSEEEAEILAKKFGCVPDDYSCIDEKLKEEFEQKEKELLSKPFLSRIDLRKNKIEITVSVKEIEELGDFTRATLIARVYQHNNKKGEFEFVGCFRKTDSLLKVNFDGFLIPNSNTILLLVSTIGQCHELGYLAEKIFPVFGIEIIDSQPLPTRELERYVTILKEPEKECKEGESFEECIQRKLGSNFWKYIEPSPLFTWERETIPSTGGILLELSLENLKQSKEIPPQKPQGLSQKEILLGIVSALIIIFAAVVILVYKRKHTKKI